MSAIEQVLASVGIGAAQLNLRVDSVVCPRGGEVIGCVELVGGIVSQKIESVWVRL